MKNNLDCSTPTRAATDKVPRYFTGLLLPSLLLVPNIAYAQTPEPATTEAPPTGTEEVPTTPETPPETTTTATEETPPPQPMPEAETPAEPPPEEVKPAEEEGGFKPSLNWGAGFRTGLAMGLSGPTEGELSLNDGLVDQAHIRPFIGGTLTDHIGFFLQFEIGTPTGVGSFSILDAIAQFRVVDEFQVWLGQHIPANDRNNMNGPFYANGWNFPIAVEEYPFDVGARDRGLTFWGLVGGGVFKYHASVVDLQPGRDIGQARYAARATVHFLEPEAFYYNSGTYFGEKDVLAIGAVISGQDGDDGADNDFLGFSVDALFEKNAGSAGTFTAEFGYWNYDETGAAYQVNQGTVNAGMGVAGPYPGEAVLGIVSWLTPDKVGPGKIQLNSTFQYADWVTEERIVVDGGLAYIVDGFNHKYHLNYRHADTTPVATGLTTSADIIQLGLQYQMSE